MKKLSKILSIILISSMIMSTGCSADNSKKRHKKDDVRTLGIEVDRPDPDYEGEINYSEVSDADYDEDAMRDSYINFCINLLSESINEEGDNSNVMVSPASVVTALQMAAAGAKDDTLNEMCSIINEDATPEEIQSFVIALTNRLNSQNYVELHSANSVWLNEPLIGEYINNSFMDYLDDTFNSETHEIDFINDDAINQINDWCDENTNGMIPELIEELSDDDVMVLVNAIVFEGDWDEAYEDYQVHDDTFTNSEGTIQDVSMFYSTESIYYETDKATGFAKYYAGGDFYFMAILPTDETISANEFLNNFTGDDYIEFLNSRTTAYDVYAHLPEFSYEYDISLVNPLSSMGMTSAFEPTLADFTNIAEIPGSNIYISDVIHKTFIDVNQYGTSAAAATAIILSEACCEMEETPSVNVYLDRPFVYAIVDASSGAPVFIGTVNEI